MVYPNSGEGWDSEARSWTDPAVAQQRQAQQSLQGRLAWTEVGCGVLVGGCCRIGPDHIRALSSALALPKATVDLLDVLGADEYAWLESKAREKAVKQTADAELDGVGHLFGAGSSSDEDELSKPSNMCFELSAQNIWHQRSSTKESSVDESHCARDLCLEYFSAGVAASGHGDVLWASAEFLAQTLSARHECFKLLAAAGMPPIHEADEAQFLHGLCVLELGAGMGIPGLVCAQRGATVVTTDIDVPAQIHCLACNAVLCARQIGARRIAVRSHTWVLVWRNSWTQHVTWVPPMALLAADQCVSTDALAADHCVGTDGAGCFDLDSWQIVSTTRIATLRC